MYIDTKHKNIGPEYETEQGTWGTPFVAVDIHDQSQRGFPVPSQIHGRHEFRMQPRPLGPGANYLEGFGEYAPGVAGSPYNFVQGYGAAASPVDDTTKFGVIILVLAVGVLAYLWGHSNGVKKNQPRRNPRRRRTTKRPRRRKQLRDAETGQFLPVE